MGVCAFGGAVERTLSRKIFTAMALYPMPPHRDKATGSLSGGPEGGGVKQSVLKLV